jgi:hypothetical protein
MTWREAFDALGPGQTVKLYIGCIYPCDHSQLRVLKMLASCYDTTQSRYRFTRSFGLVFSLTFTFTGTYVGGRGDGKALKIMTTLLPFNTIPRITRTCSVEVMMAW